MWTAIIGFTVSLRNEFENRITEFMSFIKNLRFGFWIISWWTKFTSQAYNSILTLSAVCPEIDKKRKELQQLQLPQVKQCPVGWRMKFTSKLISTQKDNLYAEIGQRDTNVNTHSLNCNARNYSSIYEMKVDNNHALFLCPRHTRQHTLS